MFRRIPVHQATNYLDWAGWYLGAGHDCVAMQLIRISAHLIDWMYQEGC
jgi:hypothetical protein